MAVTTIDGGATVGYCATGSCVIATPPITRMKSAITHAKMGRSMKNCAMRVGSAGSGWARAGGRRGRRGSAGRGRRRRRAAATAPAFTGAFGASASGSRRPSPARRSSGLRAPPSVLPSAPAPIFTCRGATLPSAPTTITLSPCGCRRHRLLRHGDAARSPAPARAARARTGRAASSPLGLGTSARRVIWPVVGSTERSENSSLPGSPDTRCRPPAPRARWPPRGRWRA